MEELLRWSKFRLEHRSERGKNHAVLIIEFKRKTAVESYHRVVPHHTLEIDAKLSVAKKP